MVWQTRVATQAGSGASADVASFFPTETLPHYSLSLAESREKPGSAEEPSPSDPYQLLLIMKDLMRIVGKYPPSEQRTA